MPQVGAARPLQAPGRQPFGPRVPSARHATANPPHRRPRAYPRTMPSGRRPRWPRDGIRGRSRRSRTATTPCCALPGGRRVPATRSPGTQRCSARPSKVTRSWATTGRSAAALRICHGVIYLADEAPEYGAGAAVSLMLPVPDVEATLAAAVKAGADPDDRGSTRGTAAATPGSSTRSVTGGASAVRCSPDRGGAPGPAPGLVTETPPMAPRGRPPRAGLRIRRDKRDPPPVSRHRVGHAQPTRSSRCASSGHLQQGGLGLS